MKKPPFWLWMVLGIALSISFVLKHVSVLWLFGWFVLSYPIYRPDALKALFRIKEKSPSMSDEEAATMTKAVRTADMVIAASGEEVSSSERTGLIQDNYLLFSREREATNEKTSD